MVLEKLFSAENIGTVQIKNRIVRSATFSRRAEKYGKVGEQMVDFYQELAAGGTGLIITGFIAVDVGGTIGPFQARLDDDSYISGQQKLVEKVHDFSEVKIAAQIAHTGKQGSHPKFPPISPSKVKDKTTGLIARELTKEEIEQFIQKFVNAGYRAYVSGYDMVQLHAAHGYFLSNFISPYTNRRSDEFGGSIEKMTRILVLIHEQLKEMTDKNFPIIIKLQTQDFVEGGLRLEDGIKIANIIMKSGFKAIEPSGGVAETQIGTKDAYPSKIIKTPDEENYFLPTAKLLKPLMKDCKLILVGGIKNPQSAERILNNGHTDFISMSRPLLYEPDLPQRWQSGDLTPAKCISCNQCYLSMLTAPTHCIVRKKLERKKERSLKNKFSNI
ncbi:MAG: NADH:flavin oxidoreductase [Promethearchaeota archaeon]|nr:MAG: NADH:flavin oxidoreductase [Candidatus Lokiarchaeota archaeon]